MALKVYNTLTQKKEEFKPLNPPKVNMYVCGITPYDDTHLGHARAYVTFDIVYRYLKYLGYKVNYIQNFTDVDDKTINRANELKIPLKELTDKYIKEYLQAMDSLGVEKATVYPRATENIREMIKHIQALIDKGYAYILEGDVYFEVDKFKEYGRLSKRNKKAMLAGARVEVDERKKNPLDFALWKAPKEGEPSWDSPWGKGRPGWHIECSVMSKKFAETATLDIHGGGMDLIFPHHENEIAQSEVLTGKPFVNYWIHNGFVTINQEKMSKSLGNFFTLKDIFKKYDPEVVRFFLLSTHYRSPINFSDRQLNEARESLERLYISVSSVESVNSVESVKAEEFRNKFFAAMDDDFNTAMAFAVLFNIAHYGNKNKVNIKDLLQELGSILGILQKEREEEIPEEVKKLIAEREVARKNKDFKKADNIRTQIIVLGYIVEDTPAGAKIRKNY